MVEENKSPIAEAPENGHGEDRQIGSPITKAVLDARGDGMVNDIIKAQNSKSGDGFLSNMASSIKDNAEYRQELKTGNFTSTKKAMEFVLAHAECLACGIPETEVVDLIIAMKAGLNGALLHELMQAYSHFSFDTGYGPNKGNNKWGQKNPDAGSNNSPLA